MCNVWLNCAFVYLYSQNLSKRQLHHNSVNDLHGSGQVLIYQCFSLSDGTYTDVSSYT